MERFRFTDGRVDRITPPRSTMGDHGEGESAQHIHIHLPDTRDANNGTAGEKNLALARPQLRDQERPNGPNGRPNGGQPQILARLLQDGTSGEWAATDGEGNALEVRRGADGALEILHHSEPQNGDEADPDVVARHPGAGYPGAGGPNAEAAIGAAHDAAADLAALRRIQRRGHAASPAEEYAGNRAWARQIASYYAKPKPRASR
jgi:hypothetical protein